MPFFRHEVWMCLRAGSRAGAGDRPHTHTHTHAHGSSPPPWCTCMMFTSSSLQVVKQALHKARRWCLLLHLRDVNYLLRAGRQAGPAQSHGGHLYTRHGSPGSGAGGPARKVRFQIFKFELQGVSRCGPARKVRFQIFEFELQGVSSCGPARKACSHFQI